MIQAEADTINILICEDSLVVAVEEPVVSLFKEHLLQPENDFSYLDRIYPGNNFGFLVLVLCSMVVIYLQRNSDGLFSSIFKASFDRGLAMQNARIENAQRARNMMILKITAGVSISLFVTILYQKLFYTELSSPSVFLRVVAVITAFFLIKRAILGVLAFIFDLHKELRVYQYNSNLLVAITGVTLLPLSLFLLFSPQIPYLIIIYAGIIAGAFFYMKGLQRGLLLALGSNSVSSVYLFYYFCALELLPCFVLIQFARNL